jgi:hypothetical protein
MEESFGIFKNIQFLEMESFNLINYLADIQSVQTNEHYRTRQGSTTILLNKPVILSGHFRGILKAYHF